MATTGFPVATVNDFLKNIDPITLADIEGIPLDPGATGILPAAYVFDGTKTPAADGYTLTTTTASAVSSRAPVTKRIAIQSPKIYTSEPLLVDVSAGSSTTIWRDVVNGNQVIPERFFIRPGESFGITAKGKVSSNSSAKILMTGGARAAVVGADVDYGADYTFYVIGADSNTEGTSLATLGTYSAMDVFTWQLKKRMAIEGYRVRLVDKSKHGYTTQHYEDFRKNRTLDLPYQPSIIFWMLGTNNPGRVDDSLFQVHVQNTIDYVRWRYPESIFIMASCLPNRESTGKQTLLATFKTQLTDKITAANTGLTIADMEYIYYCDMSDLWDKDTGLDGTSTQCYTASSVDSNGNVHANVYGHTLMYSRLLSCITDNGILTKMKKTS